MISKTEEYALRAAIQLSRRYEEGPVWTSTLAEVTGIPANYLSKVLHQLGQHGVVVSERGRNGGFRLSRPPAEITLAELLAPFAPHADRTRCLLGRDHCDDEDPCLAHPHWRDARRMIGDFFEQKTLGDIIAPGSPDSHPLTQTGGQG